LRSRDLETISGSLSSSACRWLVAVEVWSEVHQSGERQVTRTETLRSISFSKPPFQTLLTFFSFCFPVSFLLLSTAAPSSSLSRHRRLLVRRNSSHCGCRHHPSISKQNYHFVDCGASPRRDVCSRALPPTAILRAARYWRALAKTNRRDDSLTRSRRGRLDFESPLSRHSYPIS
jgi:hypothetical protein